MAQVNSLKKKADSLRILRLYTNGETHMAVSVQKRVLLLRESFQDAHSLIEFTKQIRGEKNDMSGKYSLKQSELTNLFSKAVWKDLSKRGGHRKLQNRVTGIVVEYADHSKQIDPGAAISVLNAVQKHLNILCNKIFAYTNRNWKTVPDYKQAEKRWQSMLPQ